MLTSNQPLAVQHLDLGRHHLLIEGTAEILPRYEVSHPGSIAKPSKTGDALSGLMACLFREENFR